LKNLLRNVGDAVYQDDRSRLVAAEALLRLHPERWGDDEDVQHALERFIEREGNERAAISLIGAFNVKSRFDWLIERAAEAGSDAPGPEAIGAYLRVLGEDSLRRAIDKQPPAKRRELLLAIGASGDNRMIPILLPELANADLQVSTRVQILRALAATRAGSLEVIELARTGRFPDQLRETAAALFAQSMYHPIRTEASTVFPLPRMKGSGDLPAMTDLLVRIGDPTRGRKVFQSATCAQCHQVHGTGTSLGPDLSHIGSKLAKRGIYQKILTPSASISESYRLVTVVARDGRETMGFVIGESDDEIALQMIAGPVVEFAKDAVLRRTESDESLMPAGLHQLMTPDELVDLVEYLATLK
jgi:putative heme-binding domain-containing protein